MIESISGYLLIDRDEGFGGLTAVLFVIVTPSFTDDQVRFLGCQVGVNGLQEENTIIHPDSRKPGNQKIMLVGASVSISFMSCRRVGASCSEPVLRGFAEYMSHKIAKIHQLLPKSYLDNGDECFTLFTLTTALMFVACSLLLGSHLLSDCARARKHYGVSPLGARACHCVGAKASAANLRRQTRLTRRLLRQSSMDKVR